MQWATLRKPRGLEEAGPTDRYGGVPVQAGSQCETRELAMCRIRSSSPSDQTCPHDVLTRAAASSSSSGVWKLSSLATLEAMFSGFSSLIHL